MEVHFSSGMVTAATIAMAPGVEAGSARSALSNGADIAGMLFAVSMEAELAASAPGQTTQIGQTGQASVIESVVATKEESVPKLEAGSKGQSIELAATPEKAGVAQSEIVPDGGELKTSTGKVEVLIPAASLKVSAVHSEQGKTAEVDAVPSVDQKQTAGDQVSTEISAAAPDMMDDLVQLPPAKARDRNAAETSEAETLKAVPNVSEDIEKTAGVELKDGLIDKMAGSPSHQETAKASGEVTKKEKTEKSERAEKGIAEKGESAVALAPASVPGSVQLAVPPANPAQVKLDNGQQSVDLSSPPSVKKMAGAKGRPVFAANDKDAKKAGEAKHPDEKSGLEMGAKLPTENDPKKPESGRKLELVGAAATGVESSKIGNDGAAAHAEGATAGTIGIVSTDHPAHVDTVVLPPAQVGPHVAPMQHGTAMQNEARSEMLQPGEAAPRTLVATPTVLEVGVANGTHGWLKVRAEMTGVGTVNASLAMASTSGQEMLHRELPSLTAYLHSEHVAVNTIVVQQASAAADLRGHTGGMMGDGRGQAGQNNGQPSGESRQQAARFQDPIHRIWNEGSEEMMPFTPHASGGSWLSVRA